MTHSDSTKKTPLLERTRRLADPDRHGTLFVYDLSHPVETAPPREVSARAALPGDAQALQEAMEASGLYTADTVAARLREGRRPYILETDGLIASYGWIATTAEPIGDLGISFRLAPDEAYIYDCATRPTYRGRGYYPAVLRVMLGDLRREGRRRVWIATAPGNVPSQRGIIRAGFSKVADVNMKRRPDGALEPELYGVPGVSPDLLAHAAWANQGHALPNTGIPAE